MCVCVLKKDVWEVRVAGMEIISINRLPLAFKGVSVNLNGICVNQQILYERGNFELCICEP